jgi:NhaP-type Na+/H+ or K+/H+ antiporter
LWGLNRREHVDERPPAGGLLGVDDVLPPVVRAATRQQAQAFWLMSTFRLNGALFVLIGLEAHAAVRGLTSVDLSRALIATGAVCAVLIAVRFAFLYAVTYLIRLLDRRPQQRQRRVSHRARVVTLPTIALSPLASNPAPPSRRMASV